MPADLAQFTLADFEPRIDDRFHVATPVGDVALRLVEIRSLGQSLRAGGAFSLTFLSPPGPFLPQAIHTLQNPVLGTLEIFLVPLGPKDAGNSYEAIFT
jgi:hypothetical protein